MRSDCSVTDTTSAREGQGRAEFTSCASFARHDSGRRTVRFETAWRADRRKDSPCSVSRTSIST